jgi:CheY-like chemotaxis protein
MPHTVILMVGRDRLLMETRSQVLRGAGYTVVPSFSPLQAIDKFVTGDFDLVLLFHSIPAGDRKRVAGLIRKHTSRTPVVSVASFDGQYDPFADATIKNDPNVMITGLQELLRRKAVRSEDGPDWSRKDSA